MLDSILQQSNEQRVMESVQNLIFLFPSDVWSPLLMWFFDHGLSPLWEMNCEPILKICLLEILAIHSETPLFTRALSVLRVLVLNYQKFQLGSYDKDFWITMNEAVCSCLNAAIWAQKNENVKEIFRYVESLESRLKAKGFGIIKGRNPTIIWRNIKKDLVCQFDPRISLDFSLNSSYSICFEATSSLLRILHCLQKIL